MIKIITKKPVLYSGNRIEEKTGILEFRVKPVIGISTVSNSYELKIQTFLKETKSITSYDYTQDPDDKGKFPNITYDKDFYTEIRYHVIGGVFGEDQVNQLADGLVASGLVDGLINKPVQYNKTLVAHATALEIARLSKGIEVADLEIKID